MYNPQEARKSYTLLFKEKGVEAGFKSALFVVF
jgi:hypothetical protein